MPSLPKAALIRPTRSLGVLLERLRHGRLVLDGDVEIGGRLDRLLRAGVDERARPNLAPRELLRQHAVGRANGRLPGGRRAAVGLLGMDFPTIALLRHVQPAHVDRQRIVQAEEHPHEDVDAQLPLDFDDLQLQGLEVLRIDVGIELVEEMALVLDEERDGHAVGHLAVEDRQETFAGVHAAPVGRRLRERWGDRTDIGRNKSHS